MYLLPTLVSEPVDTSNCPLSFSTWISHKHLELCFPKEFLLLLFLKGIHETMCSSLILTFLLSLPIVIQSLQFYL